MGQCTNKKYSALTTKGPVGNKCICEIPPKTWNILTLELEEGHWIARWWGANESSLASIPVPHKQAGCPGEIWGSLPPHQHLHHKKL